MILPNRPGTYLIRRALKNDSDPCDECSKRSHERQVVKVFVQRVIRSCFENNLILLRKCTMVPWYHGTTVPRYHGTMVPWYHAKMLPWYKGTMVPWYHGSMVPWYRGTMGPRYHATMVSWYHGTMEPWCHGTMVTFSQQPQIILETTTISHRTKTLIT